MARGLFQQLDWLTDKYKALCCLIKNLIPSQAGNAGEFLTTDGTTPSWAPIASSRIPLSQYGNGSFSSAGVLINEVPIGAITDNVLPRTLGGAMTTAIISKVGNFDKLAVTGGNYTSFIRFSNVWLSDFYTRVKLSIRVENLNKDGISGTSHLGLMSYGTSFTWDTGSNWNFGINCELVGKTAVSFGFSQPGTGSACTITSSSGTLVTSGDILDVEMFIDQVSLRRGLKITNKTTGQFMFAISPTFPQSIYWAGRTANLGLIAANADFTILDFKVYSSVDNPLISFVGDNYVFGYNQAYSGTLLPKLSLLTPYQFASYAVNGVQVNNIFQVQLKEALKLRPRYLFLACLNFMDGRFRTTHPDYAVWYGIFTDIIREIISRNAIPVLIKSSAGGIYAANKPDYNTFVDQQVALFPQIKVLDMSALTFQWNDSFGILGPNDFTQFANAVNNFLIAEGY